MRTAKAQLVGSSAALVRPAWRQQPTPPTDDAGSKILLSKLPADVAEPEIEELFKKTVGPLKDCFVVYNSQGRSKGIAVVSFLRPGDAAVARQKYHGKIVDGRRPIKIEIIVDGFPTLQAAPPLPGPSLLNRLGMAPIEDAPPKTTTNGIAVTPRSRSFSKASPSTPRYPPAPVRRKKGPRRVQKSLAQLDKEMEEYRAASDVFNLGINDVPI